MEWGASTSATSSSFEEMLASPAVLGVTVLLAQWSSLFYVLTALVVLADIALLAILTVALGWDVVENRLFVKRLLYSLAVGGLTMALSAFWVGTVPARTTSS